MQKWQADLWHSSISRKKKEPAVNILWPLVHYYVFLVVSIISHLFPPYTPWCAPFYHGTSPQVNFLFLAFFLPVPYFRYSFQRSKNNLLGGLAAPKFSHFQNFATQNASIAHIKGYFWVAKLQNNYTRQSTFLNSDPVVFFYPVSVGPLPSSSCPCDAPWPPVLPIWKRDRKNVP